MAKSTKNKFSGKFLREMRKATKVTKGTGNGKRITHFTQAELAKKVGISRETVVAIENEHPKTIDALTLEVVNDWWVTCRFNGIPESMKLQFKSEVLKFFGM